MKKIICFGTMLILISFVFCSKDKKKDNVEYKKFSDSTTVALVNDQVITFTELDAASRQFIMQAGLTNKVNPTDSLIRKQALDWLIANALLRAAAEKQLIEVKEEEIESAIAMVKRNFRSDEEFNQILFAENLSQKKFRENITTDIKVQKLLDQEVIKQVAEITKEEANKYYKENEAQFTEPSKVRARHILVKLKKDASEAEMEPVLKKVALIHERILKGDDFALLAKTYSEDPAAVKGGDLGFFARGEMVKSFEDAVFALKVGEISDPVRTDFGFHIIKLEEVKDPTVIPFEKIEEKIKFYLKQMNSNKLFEEYISKLKQKSKIKIRENV